MVGCCVVGWLVDVVFAGVSVVAVAVAVVADVAVVVVIVVIFCCCYSLDCL